MPCTRDKVKKNTESNYEKQKGRKRVKGEEGTTRDGTAESGDDDAVHDVVFGIVLVTVIIMITITVMSVSVLIVIVIVATLSLFIALIYYCLFVCLFCGTTMGNEMDWTGLVEWNGLDWNWNGLEWNGMEWTECIYDTDTDTPAS